MAPALRIDLTRGLVDSVPCVWVTQCHIALLVLFEYASYPFSHQLGESSALPPRYVAELFEVF